MDSINPADLIWEGDSREVLYSFPRTVRHDLGYALYQVQLGQHPIHSRSMQSVGQGVFELKEQDENGWYRHVSEEDRYQDFRFALLPKSLCQDQSQGSCNSSEATIYRQGTDTE